MSTALAALALAIFFALPTFLLTLGLIHFLVAVVRFVRDLSSANRTGSIQIKP